MLSRTRHAGSGVSAQDGNDGIHLTEAHFVAFREKTEGMRSMTLAMLASG